jgi:hypothetical protein
MGAVEGARRSARRRGRSPRGDPRAAEAEAREAIRAWAKDIYGVNLAKFKLTHRGLIKR